MVKVKIWENIMNKKKNDNKNNVFIKCIKIETRIQIWFGNRETL